MAGEAAVDTRSTAPQEAEETLDPTDLEAALEGEAAGTGSPEEQARESARKYFEAQEEERKALTGKLVTPFLIVAVVKFCLNLAKNLTAYVAEVAALPGARPERLNLRGRTLALWHAENRHQFATKGASLERALADEGKVLRDLILRDWGTPMVRWGVITEQEHKQLLKGNDRDDLASDLAFIGDRCVAQWAKLKGRVTFTLEDAQRASYVGHRLIEARAVGGKVESEALNTDDTSADLARAFTLVVQSVNTYRAGLGWTRHDDPDFVLDEVCPSVYSVRRPPRPTVVETASPQEPAAQEPQSEEPDSEEPPLAG